MEITYIYELSKNGIPFYIGKTKDLKDRENKHKKKHGNDIIMTEIDSVNSFDKKYWKPLETFWITQYKSFGFELINKNEGGGGQGGWRTQEDKKRYMKEYDKRKNNELKKENKCRGSYTPTQQLQYWKNYISDPKKHELYKQKQQEYYLKNKEKKKE